MKVLLIEILKILLKIIYAPIKLFKTKNRIVYLSRQSNDKSLDMKLLEEAGEKLADVLEKVTISELQIPYVTNVTAEFVKEHQKIRSLLAKQISSPVKWQQSVEAMIAEGVDTFIEIGPGKTLAGFMRKINRNAKVYNVQTVEDIEKVVQECSRK